jgi:hypothetical protein
MDLPRLCGGGNADRFGIKVHSKGVELRKAVYPPGDGKTTGYGPEEGEHRHVRAHHIAGYAVNPRLALR